MEKIPNKFDICTLYVQLFKKFLANGRHPKEIVFKKDKTPQITKEEEQIVLDELSHWSMGQKMYLRALNDSLRYNIGDHTLNIALVLSYMLPTFKDLERYEEPSRKPVESLNNAVVTSHSLIFEHLAKEDPFYLRRLIQSSVSMREYQFYSPALNEQVQTGMEAISADWLLNRTKHDAEALSIVSMLDNYARPCNMASDSEPRFKVVGQMMPTLVNLASFHRSEITNFAKFVNLLPSILVWTIGNYDGSIKPEEEDSLVDLLEAVLTFSRTLQANADKASRIRQMLYHGFPVYKELLDLARQHNSSMNWTFEQIVFRVSHNLEVMLRNKGNEEVIMKFIVGSGIAELYAKHKECHIAR